jgi:hypothetical protein
VRMRHFRCCVAAETLLIAIVFVNRYHRSCTENALHSNYLGKNWMGGYGSGFRGVRKLVVEGFERQRIYDLEGIRPDQQQITFKLGEQLHTASLTWTKCHFGSRRPWFACAKCSGRCAVLHLKYQRLWCRKCHGLSYLSSQASSLNRPLIQNRRLCQKLKGSAHFLPGATLAPVKPRKMRWSTYERLCDRILSNDRRRNLILSRQLYSMAKRLRGL